jgi:hypothetical protein
MADRAERGRADDHQLGPAEEKGSETTPPFPEEDIDPAGVGERASDFRQRQCAAHCERAADHPHDEQRRWAGQPIGETRR